MLTRNPYILLGLAATFGLGAAVFASHWLQNRASAAEQGMQGAHPVVVTASEIAFGSRITREQILLKAWPADSVPVDAYTRLDEVVGKFANQKLMPGEVVLRGRAVALGGGSSLSMQIEPDKRAVTVRVNDVIGVGGFLLPGNRVDVLATRMTEDRRAMTRTLLQNLKVLAVDQSAQADKDQPVVVRAVTLEMEPSQAESLVSATEEGTVQLALRNPDDGTLTETPADAPAPPATPVAVARTRAPRPAPAPQQAVVTMIRQAQVESAQVRQ